MIISATFHIKPFLRGLRTGAVDLLLTGLLGAFALTGLRGLILIFGGVGGNWFSLLSLSIIMSFLFMAAICAGIVYRFGTPHHSINFQSDLPTLWTVLHHASTTVNNNAADMGSIMGKFPSISNTNPLLWR